MRQKTFLRLTFHTLVAIAHLHLCSPAQKKQLPEAMEPTIAAVLENKADLGIVLDTDVDRSGVVDKNGVAINRNRLIAFLATVVLRDHPGSTIVTDSTTSNGLKVSSRSLRK